ncbi:Polysaccharide pyruvyl transferase [Halobacillus karajensis]|uniref:polysaccharide pyruvyl transferase family protein n=1 Tax=Halobacillus karajensis TaxID=195088 RepID=UPI0008A77C79|nr:polysaccharide pyruvyl transferase family protein [Halobacillus karajensis]SEH87874.1 Polysaccharide pyruvyl transferase [Halobacillus karajensis]
MMTYLVLSTFPANGSGNSGDALITKSLIQLIHKVKGYKQIDVKRLAEEDIDQVQDFSKYKAVIFAGFAPKVDGAGLAPRYRNRYLQEAVKRSIPVFVFGSGWTVYPGNVNQSKRLRLADDEKELLVRTFGYTGESLQKNVFSTRDQPTERLLTKNGVKTYGTIGDCALFDVDQLFTKPKLPESIQRVAVSMPHNSAHFLFAYELAKAIKKDFSCDVSLTLHSKWSKKRMALWGKDDIPLIDLAGGAKKLSHYKNYDLHVGFRLHGHIWFLRNRKPSLLLGEDGRGFGHLQTFRGLGGSVVPKHYLDHTLERIEVKDPLYQTMKKSLPDFDPLEMMKEEIIAGYPVTKRTLEQIDRLWVKKMEPMLRMLPD